MITTEHDLESALASGGVVDLDDSVEVDLTSVQWITRPTRLVGGSFRVFDRAGFRISSSHVEISGVTMSGPGHGNRISGQKFICAQGTSQDPLTEISIHNNSLIGSRSDNIWLAWCANSTVENNLIEDYLHSGVMVVSGERIVIRDNDISNAPLSEGIVHTYGISLTDVENTVAARTRNCVVSGNRVHLIDWEGIDTYGGDAITITGNTVTASTRGIALVTGNPNRVAAPTNCTVSDNSIDGRDARKKLREGIVLAGTPEWLADAVISENQINGPYRGPLHIDHIDREKTRVDTNDIALVP